MKIFLFLFLVAVSVSCTNTSSSRLQYYETGVKNKPADWRDSSFVVATADPQLIAEIEAQLKLPVSQRKMLTGALLPGNGGYNKNGTHEFKWHYKEDDWGFAEISMELCDGRPYSDVDLNPDYWLNTVKRFCPWNSYIKKRI